MVKRQGRHTTAHKLWVALEALVGNKTISQCLNIRMPTEEHYFIRCRQTAHR